MAKSLKPIKLNLKETVELIPTAPFAFDSTFHKPDHFTSGDNLWEKGMKWQTWNWQGECLGLKFINKGTIEKPKILLTIYSQKPLNEEFKNSLIKEIKYLYNLDLNLSDFYKRFEKDQVLGPIIKKFKGMKPG
ncbi:hypothetical protein M1349_02770, partial [Patescibacteria group bacterium]|nr:hypothetical protein [Patescibacteria group bacterium]